MGKIALVSYQFWYNYGTCFQAYALWKKINDLGFSSEYLNFGWEYPIDDDCYKNHFWKKNGFKYSQIKMIVYHFKKYLRMLKCRQNFLKQFLVDIVLYANNKRFDQFKESYIKESRLVRDSDMDLIQNEYSLFVVGSDQVWNPDCCEDKFFKRFLLDFVDKSKKKASYAPSIGRSVLSNKTFSDFKEYLSDFAFLSCREERGCRLLESCLNRTITHVLDPTLLINAEEWRKIEKVPKRGKFVLCYLLGTRTCVVDYAKKIADAQKIPLVLITMESIIIKKYHKFVGIGVGPLELLGLIDKCSVCVTDSFHGTIFCINYNKPFYSFMKRDGGENSSDNSRIIDTLKFFHLENRFVDDDTAHLEDAIEFDTTNEILRRERIKSLIYLKNIVESVVTR